MIKKSYKNKRNERVKTLKNISLSTPDSSIQNEPTSGVSSHFYPTPMIKELEETFSEEEIEKSLESLNKEYFNKFKKDSYYDVINVFIKLSSDKDYFQKMKDLISIIINSNPLFYEEEVDQVVSAYYAKYKTAIRDGSDHPEKEAYLGAYEAYKDKIVKSAQYVENDPVYVAKQIISIIDIMINRMKPESRVGSYGNLYDKISDINPAELAAKKSPGGAALGISISLLKNILISRDPFFINVVKQEVLKRLKRW